jgi:uncharacterized membrane protein
VTIEMDTIPRTSGPLYRVSLLLVLIGIIISGYLSYSKLTSTDLICLDSEVINCDLVQNSIYARLAGIDISYLGLLAYLMLGGLLLLEHRVPLLRDYGSTLIFGATLFAFLYAVWLVYVQAVLLTAFCSWCLAHEVTITLLFVVSAIRLWQHLRK